MSNLSKKGVSVIAGCMMMAILIQCFVCSIASAQLNENCTISVLNRTVNVDSEGNWQLNNVPSNMGQVRVRVTCTEDGKTVSGQSEYVTIQTNGNIPVEEIFFNNDYEQVPTALTINSEKSVLGTTGETTRLTVWATYPDGSILDVTSSGQGTAYTVSNPSIGTVSSNGLVTAITSGNLIVSASNEMVLSSISIPVQLSGDSDGDGMPDDFELANGLNPNNPIDALEDMDTDGLTNLEEFNLGTGVNNADTDGDGIADGEEVMAGNDGFITNPLLGDSDGDGIWDGLEVSSGTDPNDAGSFNLAATLNYIEVTPLNFVIVFNTIMGEATRQLTVTGTLTDGRTIDLTSSSFGTNYSSSDLTVANFGLTDGLVYAGTDGMATITATNNGFSDTATVSVETFSPTALSYVQLPSSAYANNVDIAGSYAYVAGGAGGLFVVDVSNPDSPFIVTSLDTPGTSIDVKVSGNNAYIADGSSGLRIIDVSAPSVPLELGFVDTPGIAQDLVKRDNLVFVADGTSGLQIIDVTNPDNPTIMSFVDTPGTAKGVDVEGNIALVADGNTVQIIDITDPALPTILGSVPVSGNVLDLVVRDNYAYVTAYNGGFHVVDFSTPANPSVVATSNAIVPRDVALSDQFALFAEQLFPNVVAIYNIATPTSPAFTTTINFSPLGDYAGTGIALTREYVYFTSQSFVVTVDYGTTGNTRLFIGQYRNLQDFGTVPPTVSITSPLEGDVVMEGSIINMSVDTTDDVFVFSVSFLIDGEVVFTDTSTPYQFDYTVPVGITGFVVSATAIDLANNIGTTEDVVLDVIPDPLTTLIGSIVDIAGNPIAGVTISTINSLTTTTASDGTFSITDVQTALGDIPVTGSVVINGMLYITSTFYVTPVPGGITDAGEIVGNFIQGEVFDHFDDNELNPIWQISFSDTAGWDYSESGTLLTVTDISSTVLNTGSGGTWGRVFLSQSAPALDNFEADFHFRWDSEGQIQAMQQLIIRIYDENEGLIAGGGYNDAWVSQAASKFGFAGGSSFNAGSDSLTLSGSAVIKITRENNFVRFYWDSQEMVSGTSFGKVGRVEIEFNHYAFDNGAWISFIGNESVDLISLRPLP